jgi:chemotaxis signal transduction protein
MRPVLPHKPQPLRSEQIILFRAGGQLFAISSASVQEVRSMESVTNTGRTVSHPDIAKVQHFVQRGEASLYVVNAAMHFGLPPASPELVFVLRRTRTALLVDGIERMASMTRLQALPHAFCHEEREWYRGLTALDQSVIPVIKPEGFLTEDELFALDATMLQAGAKDSTVNAQRDVVGTQSAAADAHLGNHPGTSNPDPGDSDTADPFEAAGLIATEDADGSATQ